MNQELHDVRQFMEACDQPVRHNPVTAGVPFEERALRIRLLLEEVHELAESVGISFTLPHLYSAGTPNYPVRIVDTLDALTDIRYILAGTYHTYGLACVAQPAWDEVQRSNMSKVGPDGKVIRRDDGKILKPDGYVPPNLSKVLDSHRPINPFSETA